MPHNSPEPAVRPPHPLALALIERLRDRPGARVLEIGAGSGRNTRALLAAGCAVVPVGATSELCAAALSTHDLLHGTPGTIAARLERIAAQLEPGAPLYATFGSRRDARYGVGTRIDEHVFAPLDGDEAGVAHAFFEREPLEALIRRQFVVEALDERGVDGIAGSWAHRALPLHGAVHWFALLRNGGSGVRALRREDVPAWIEMRRSLWPDATSDELAADSDPMLAGTNDARAFVYENAAGDLEGMLELSLRSAAEERSGSPVPFIEAWYVREQARGRGVGRALVDAAQRWARAHGFGKTASEARCRFGGG